MQTKIPIIILASERSGTNLLRTLLGNHSQICAPVAPHFLDTFSTFIGKYGDLRNNKNSKKLLHDMLRLANHPYHYWKLELELDKLNFDKLNDLVSIFNYIYTEKAKSEDKAHYVSKGIHNFKYIHQIKSQLPQVKFIHLYRDPRDNVTSWLRTPLFMHTAYDIVKKWDNEQSIILRQKDSYGIDMLEISYESILSDTEQTISKMLNFIGVEVEKACFNTDSDNKESKRNEFWKNLAKPIMQENKKKYLDKLSAKELLMVESIAKINMEKLGYNDFETSADWEWKPYRGIGTRMRVQRAISKRKHKELREGKMSDLQDKLKLIRDIRNG